jgi:hypothetical protein
MFGKRRETGVFQAFVFNELAVTVRHWYEISGNPDEEEHGVRVEVRRLRSQHHRGSLAAPQLLELDEILWRGDLFDRVGDEPGSFARAHHHTRFNGYEPLDRAWDDELSEDPLAWTAQHLGDVGALARTAGVILDDAEGETQDVRNHLPWIMEAVRRTSPLACTSPEHCLEETRDTRKLMLRMLTERRGITDTPRDPRAAAEHHAENSPPPHPTS